LTLNFCLHGSRLFFLFLCTGLPCHILYPTLSNSLVLPHCILMAFFFYALGVNAQTLPSTPLYGRSLLVNAGGPQLSGMVFQFSSHFFGLTCLTVVMPLAHPPLPRERQIAPFSPVFNAQQQSANQLPGVPVYFFLISPSGQHSLGDSVFFPPCFFFFYKSKPSFRFLVQSFRGPHVVLLCPSPVVFFNSARPGRTPVSRPRPICLGRSPCCFFLIPSEKACARPARMGFCLPGLTSPLQHRSPPLPSHSYLLPTDLDSSQPLLRSMARGCPVRFPVCFLP